jgi:hypothetical protein
MKPGALAVAAACLLSSAALASPVTELAPGNRYVLEPGDAECFETAHAEPIGGLDPLCPIRAGATCEADGQASLAVISCVTLRSASASAHAHYQVWFQVKPPPEVALAPAAAQPSFVPIHVYAPDVVWDLRLRNGAVDEEAGLSSARYALRLRADPADDLVERGEIVTEESVLLASHGGISGCMSIPTGVDDLVNLAISCQLATAQFQQGRASPSLSAIVEVGRTYNLELAVDFAAHKRATLKPTALEVSGRRDEFDPTRILPGETNLKWSRLVVTIGSDTSALERQLEALRADFEQHGHTYRTGPGADHNSIGVSTSRPSVPDGGAHVDDADRDGVLDGADACPDSVAGVPVNAVGCSLEAFCALHTRGSECRNADWDGDGSAANACNWQRQACRAAY